MRNAGKWDLFLKNLKKDVDTFFNETDPCDYLAAGFPFKGSPEGQDFWIRLQDEWDEFMKRLYK